MFCPKPLRFTNIQQYFKALKTYLIYLLMFKFSKLIVQGNTTNLKRLKTPEKSLVV